MYKIRKITFHNHPILGNLFLNFCNPEGKSVDTVILAGENGTGKSTILNAIYTLVSRVADFEADVEYETNDTVFVMTYKYKDFKDGSRYLYASDGTLITNSTSINRSQGVWVSLSSSIIQKIQSGAIKYFYLKADSNNTATYFKCESNAKIEITYTK